VKSKESTRSCVVNLFGLIALEIEILCLNFNVFKNLGAKFLRNLLLWRGQLLAFFLVRGGYARIQ